MGNAPKEFFNTANKKERKGGKGRGGGGEKEGRKWGEGGRVPKAGHVR